jgi:two-component system chemotaxis sensor kinase CheA
MGVRMMPIEETFNRCRRMVRDLAQELGKSVSLETFGTETELDKTVIEQLADPLKHMVRNAVAHGLEAPAERTRCGKSETGRIELRAAQRQGHIVIEVSDDGRGMDPEVVLEKARSLGLVGEAERPEDRQILDFVFRPGFSTAKEVDEISGRGVGLDVVRKNVQGLRGTIELDSTVGRGTTFRIKLPLTLAIIDGMNVRVGRETLTIPLLSVVELIAPGKDQLASVEGKGELVNVRGEYLPMIRLGDVLHTAEAGPRLASSVVVIVENDRRKFGIMVDRVLGMDQTVVKPLDRAFSVVNSLDRGYVKPEGVSGATILGDGNVGLILDVPGIERMAFGELR